MFLEICSRNRIYPSVSRDKECEIGLVSKISAKVHFIFGFNALYCVKGLAWMAQISGF